MERLTAAQFRASQRAAPRDLEGPVHRAVLAYLRAALPGAVITHVPNETDLRGKEVARTIAKQKALGMLPGFPDLVAFWRGRVFAFEVKAGRNTASEAQLAVGLALEAQGVRWAVVRSVDEARACVERWRAEAPGAVQVEMRGGIS